MRQNNIETKISISSRQNLVVKQQGFVISGFTLAIAAIVLAFVLGYSLYTTKKEALFLSQKNEIYLAELKDQLTQLYIKEAELIDGTETNAAENFQWWLNNAGITPKVTLQGAVSNRLSRNGVMYRTIAVWLETNTDISNPPIFNKGTGNFQSCTDLSAPCDEKQMVVVDGFDVQQEHLTRTYYTLKQIAGKLTTYFKARYLSDPDKNISINWFRSRITQPACSPIEDDLGCWDDYLEGIGTVADDLVKKVGIGRDELRNSWGMPIFFSNKKDSSHEQPPYSMSIKTNTPWGTEITIKSVQPL